MSIVALLHFLVGTCSVVAGFTSLFAKKGSGIHKFAGLIYVIAMVILCLSGFYLSYVRELQFTFLLSALSLYLVVTGWLAIKQNLLHTTVRARLEVTCSALLCLTCFALSALGISLNWPYPSTEPPYEAYAFIGLCTGFFVYGDIKQLMSGIHEKASQFKRHLTRIGASMLIATIVFFLGNNHVLPDAFRTVPILLAPIVTVFVITSFYRFQYSQILERK
ncbi:DUF2306 domain-containing protein [Alteromonas flava]|uniref:DUF2306 domain-containing protein n=1 Tax=Alteromonas flava TaxID=2048003 RepID=UPI000C28CFD9|nr:DUF2306 domain-containing protein [Alteromonas flava]